jgi:uncharacterized protein (DUF1697 family)
MAAGKDTTYVALLRGINVGGNNKLPMKDLAALVGACGGRDVRTYIQSGNVVFGASAGTDEKTLASKLAKRIAADHGLAIPVVLRTAAELAQVAERNPFLAAGKAIETLYVMFLADTPGKAAIATLDPRRSPPDELAVVGREVYLHLPNGAGRSKLTNAYLDSKLQTVSTARNWRTLLALIEMTRAR